MEDCCFRFRCCYSFHCMLFLMRHFASFGARQTTKIHMQVSCIKYVSACLYNIHTHISRPMTHTSIMVWPDHPISYCDQVTSLHRCDLITPLLQVEGFGYFSFTFYFISFHISFYITFNLIFHLWKSIRPTPWNKMSACIRVKCCTPWATLPINNQISEDKTEFMWLKKFYQGAIFI